MTDVIKMSNSRGDSSKSERIVNVTVNNNTSSKSNGNSNSSLITGQNHQPLNHVKPVSTTTAALVQAYLTLNNMANTTRSSSNNVRTPIDNNAVVMSAPSVSVKCDFYVKVLNPNRKKEFSTYVLRDITKEKMSTPQKLRRELNQQFGDALISSKLDFPVGYMKNSAKVSIRTSADINDIWKAATKSDQVTLWCYGISSNETSTDDDSDIEIKHQSKKRKVSALQEKNKWIDKTVVLLREKHSSRYTTIQYRLWAEMLDVGTHR